MLSALCERVLWSPVKDFPFSDTDFLDLRNGAKNTFEEWWAMDFG